MKRAATIERAYFQVTAQLGVGAGSTQVVNLLLDLVGPRVCLVEVTRTEGCFTYAVDADWAEMGISLMDGNHRYDEFSSLQLPRSALQAVIAGWPTDWDAVENPRLEVHLSDDLVPHVSVLEDQRVSGRSTDAQPPLPSATTRSDIVPGV